MNIAGLCLCFYMCVCLWGFEYCLNIFHITGPCVYGQRLNIAGLCLSGTMNIYVAHVRLRCWCVFFISICVCLYLCMWREVEYCRTLSWWVGGYLAHVRLKCFDMCALLFRPRCQDVGRCHFMK